MTMEEAVAVIVPLCLDLKDRHGRGEKLYVHPSAIAASADGSTQRPPTSARKS